MHHPKNKFAKKNVKQINHKCIKAIKAISGGNVFGDKALDIGERAYDGAAAYGTFMALIGLIVGSIIGLALFAVGIYLVFSTPAQSKIIVAKVLKSDCRIVHRDGEKSEFDCVMDVSYRVNDTEYTKQIIHNKNVAAGQEIQLNYNPSNPSDASKKGFSRKKLGLILLVIGLLIVLGSSINYYIARRFKMAAAANGVGSLANLVSQ